MKKIIGILLVICIAVLSVGFVNAEGEAIISLENIKAVSGEDITVPLKVENSTKGVATIQLTVDYDSSYLEYIGFDKGIYQGETIINSTTDLNQLTLVTMAIQNYMGDGTLFNLKFKVKDTAEKNITVPLTLNVREFHYLDSNYDQILVEHTVKNGSVIINEESKPTATTTTTTETTTQATTKEPVTQTTTQVATTQATTKEPDTQTTTQVPTTQATTQAPVVTTEVQTESTTAAVTETGTETTTVRLSSGGSSGGGGGGRGHKRPTAVTTEATTETTTAEAETRSAEKSTEETTQTAKEDIINKEVRVSIGSYIVSVGDNKFTIDVAPYIQAESNSTLVPLRFVAIAILGDDVENADASNIVDWDAAAKTASIAVAGNVIKFMAGSNEMIINDNAVAMDYDVKAEIKDNRMYIPFRALGNALGVSVDWESNTKTAVYKIK